MTNDDELPPLPHVQPLSGADRNLFLAILDNPPAPNAALNKLMSNQGKKDVTNDDVNEAGDHRWS